MDATLNRDKWIVFRTKNWSEPAEQTEYYSELLEHYVPASSRIVGVSNGGSAFGRVIRKLHRLYEFRGVREGLAVENFLQENSFLGSLLFEAYEEVRNHFGFGVRIALEIVADPEAQEDQQLFVVIRTKFPPKAARVLLSGLDQDWWLDALLKAQGKMGISLEYA